VDSRDRGGGGGGGAQRASAGSPSSITSGVSMGGSVFSGAGGEAGEWRDNDRVPGGPGFGDPAVLGDSDSDDVGAHGTLKSYLLLCLQGLSVGSLLLVVVAVSGLIFLHPMLLQCGYFQRDGGGGVAAPTNIRALLHCITSPACRADAGEHCAAGAGRRLQAQKGDAKGLSLLLWTLLSVHLACACAAALWALHDLGVCRRIWGRVSSFAALERCARRGE
jgi:hypothetical protein